MNFTFNNPAFFDIKFPDIKLKIYIKEPGWLQIFATKGFLWQGRKAQWTFGQKLHN